LKEKTIFDFASIFWLIKNSELFFQYSLDAISKGSDWLDLKVDTHTHSIMSGHAYSTIEEMAVGARKNGTEMFIVAEHGPVLEGAPSEIYFRNFRYLPAVINGVRVVKGCEANIIDFDGSIDIGERSIDRLEYIVASFHGICIKPSTVENHMKAVINLMKNPYVDVIGHPGNGSFPLDYERFVLAAKEYGKPVEINNHSFLVRRGSKENCAEIMKLCKKHQVPIVCASDAHFSAMVGVMTTVQKLISEVKMPEELVLSSSLERMEKYLELRKKRIV
jgi:putative hydrolase